jgi:glycosyltransferase involved in cell wall biosynthesis
MAVHLARGLKVRGHDVTVVCLRGSGPLEASLREFGVDVAALHKPEGFHWTTARKLAEILKARRIDVVHTHNPLVHHYGLISSRLAHAPVLVSTVHGLDNLDKRDAGEFLYGVTARFTDRVLTVCQMAKEVFRRHPYLPAAKLETIYNGIPLGPFLEVPAKQPGNEFLFGAVGRLAPVKNHEMLIRAFGQVSRAAPRARLEILGGGPLYESLGALIAGLGLTGKARLMGESLDVAGFYRRMDVFVHSSVSEGLPMTLLEAMASARPVVVTSVGGLTELVELSGCGWLSPEGDEDRFAAAMMEAMDASDLIVRGAKGREFARTNCSVEEMVGRHEALFEKLLREKR